MTRTTEREQLIQQGSCKKCIKQDWTLPFSFVVCFPGLLSACVLIDPLSGPTQVLVKRLFQEVQGKVSIETLIKLDDTDHVRLTFASDFNFTLICGKPAVRLCLQRIQILNRSPCFCLCRTAPLPAV